MLPPPVPSNAFEALDATPVKMVPAGDLPEFKRLVLENQKLSKAGLLEVLAKSFDNSKVTRALVKNTLERVAEKKTIRGLWELKPGYEL